MKKLLLVFILAAMISGLDAQTQNNTIRPAKNPFLNVAELKPVFGEPVHFTTKASNNFVRNIKTLPVETEIGKTRYDLQTNAVSQKRIHRYPDGTIGATWTLGIQDLGGFPDRGTGYNYFDGSGWSAIPLARIESIRTGWPSYTPWGAAGELIVCHDFTATTGSLVLLKRPTKGFGMWQQSNLYGPTGHGDLAWPRSITAGADHNTIHVLANTKSIANGGTIYNGLNGAVVYSRSTDGGMTWNPQNIILPGMDSSEYIYFSADQYTWADSRGDTIAFIVGDSWCDLFIMKSTDNGTSWTKTVIWEHPYPKFDPNNPVLTDTFYSPDGVFDITLDNQGKAHVAFGVNRAGAHDDGAGGVGTYYYPYVDGIAYWNESMPPFTSSDFKYTLQPDSLFNSGHLVAWIQDINQNDTIDYADDPDGAGPLLGMGKYYISPTSMPQLTVDDNGDIFLIFSMLMENRVSSAGQNFRHIWGRMKTAGSVEWYDFFDLTGTIIHNFDECIYPALAKSTDNSLHFTYQADEEPGLNTQGDEDGVTNNSIWYSSALKTDFGLGVEEIRPDIVFVSQNYPNPFSGYSEILVSLQRSSSLSLAVQTISGQLISVTEKGFCAPGYHTFTIDASGLAPGIYFYTVTSGNQHTTRKMIVR